MTDEIMETYIEGKVRGRLRDNAFSKAPVWMFEAMEDLIRKRVAEAGEFFGADGRLRENRLREVNELPIEAAAQSRALHQCGECW
jgi:hypothetical protein